MDTVEAVIEALGGDGVVSLRCQVQKNTVTYWRRRDRIPPPYWDTLVALAKGQNVAGVDHALFTKLWGVRRGRTLTVSSAA